MKKIILTALAVVFSATLPIMAGGYFTGVNHNNFNNSKQGSYSNNSNQSNQSNYNNNQNQSNYNNSNQSNYNNSNQNNYNNNNQGNYNNGSQVDPNDQAAVTLLWMVYSDIQMCRNSLSQSIMDNVSAMGHVNNAKSAIAKSNLDIAYAPLMAEITKRLSKIKFYLVMNDKSAVAERAQQLMMVIRNVLGAKGANMSNNGNYNSNYNGNYNNGYNNSNSNYYRPNGSGYVNPEIPVGNFGGGNSSPVLPTIPSGVVPVR